MPRWARFVSCTFTGLLLSLVGFLMTAYWYEGGPTYWESLLDFLATPGFYSLVLLVTLMAAVTLVVGRLAANLCGFSDTIAGLLAGGVVAAAYCVLLVSMNASEWGGLGVATQRAWPAAGVFSAPFALAGAFTAWLWDRLD